MARDGNKERALEHVFLVMLFVAMTSIGFGRAIALAEGYQPLDWDAYSSSPDYWIEEDVYTQSFDPTRPDYVFKEKQDKVFGGTSYAGVFSLVDWTEEDAESLEIRAYQEGSSTLVASQTLTVNVPVSKGLNSFYDNLQSFQTPDFNSVKWDSGIFEIEPWSGGMKANGGFQTSYHEKAPCMYTVYKGDMKLEYWTRLNSLAQKEDNNYEAFVTYKGCSGPEQYERYLNGYDLEERVDGARHVFIWSSKKNGVETKQSQTDYTNSEGKTRYEPTTIETTTDIRQYYVIDELPEVPGYYQQIGIRIENNLKTCKTADGTYISPEGQIQIDEINYMHDALDGEVIEELLAIRPTVTWGEPNSLKSDKPIQEQVTIDTDAEEKPGETDNGWVIPAAIVGGIAVVGGAAALGLRGRRKSGSDSDPDPDDDQQEEKPQSTFRMQLYKEFGDTLFVGANAETVGARIEEVTEDGVIGRDDLTARISFSASDNLEAQAIGMQGHYQCLNVKATNVDSPTAIVSIAFKGEGGTFTNNVKFKVGTSELFFGDVALTFIAGYKQTLSIPFCFKGMQLPQGAEPTFECTVWAAVAGQGSDYFTDIEVVRDREHPEAVWNVRLTETGAKPQLEPGELERFTCEVVAKWKTDTGEQTLSGIFDLYRFVEGIRLHVEPLKCYAVDRKAKFVEFRGRSEGETPAEFREKLDAWRAQLPEDSAKNEYVIPVECEGVVSQAARSVISATLYTWAAGQVDADGKFVFGPYGEEFTEIPPWDGTEGWLAIKAVNPLPEFGKTKIEFADVEGSSVLKDVDGNDVAHPCEAMGFGYFLKKIDHESNEQTFHVVATKGVLTPPNRVEVDVTVRIEWGGRKFERTERVMAISQPWRTDYAEKAGAYDAADAEKREKLEYIQRKILNSDTTTWKIEGGLSLTETMGAIADGLEEKTLVEGAKEKAFGAGQSSLQKGTYKVAEKATEANPLYQFANGVEKAGRVAVNVVGSIPGQLETRYVTYTEYGDMMPLYHYIQMMIDGYDAHYGFHEPDYIRVTGAFLRRARGETGPAQAAMEALFSRELQYADAVRMTVKDWNESWLLIGINVGCAIATSGLSDLFFIPLAAIGKGLEGAIDCIDKGGADNLEIFRSTLDAAGRQLVFDVAMGKVVEEGMKWGSWGAKFAKETAEGMSQWIGAEQAFQKAVGGLKSAFSSGASGKVVSGTAKALAKELDEAKKVALAAKKAFEESAESMSEELVERDISYCLGRIEGKLKLKNIDKVMKAGAKDLTRFERRQLLYAIQCDKHAMRALRADKSELGKAVRKFYNAEIKEVQEKAIHMARVRLSDTQKCKFEHIRVKGGATGNVADDVVEGLTTPMDLDVTFQRYAGLDKEGKEIWVDIVEKDAQPVFDQELFKIVHGYEGTAETAAAFTKSADHTVVDALGKESYGTWDDLMRVVNAHRAGETLEHADTVGMAAEYKCVHWENAAKQARAEAKALRASGDMAKAQLLEEAAEAFSEEGGRQFTKQASRIVEERIAVLKKAGVDIPFDVQSFLNKKMAIDLMGIEKVDGATAAEVEKMLQSQFRSSLEETYHELNQLTVLLNDEVAKLNGDFMKPGVVKNL